MQCGRNLHDLCARPYGVMLHGDDEVEVHRHSDLRVLDVNRDGAGPAALRVAWVASAVRRPQVTITSGQGGCRRSGRASAVHGQFTPPRTVFSITTSATARARPRAWVRMPTSPVVTAQAVIGA